MRILNVKRFLPFLFVFLTVMILNAEIVGINNRLDNISVFGIVGIKGDFAAMELNPAAIISTMPDKDFTVKAELNYITNPSYSGVFIIHSSVISFPLLAAYNNSIFHDSVNDALISSQSFMVSAGFTDPYAGTGVIGGFNFKYVLLEETVNNDSVHGSTIEADIGLIKQFGQFKAGTSWHTGGRVKWDINTVLENAVPGSFDMTLSWSGKKLFFVGNWNHIFPARSYVSYSSTKQIILRDGEDRLGLTGIYAISQNINLQLGVENLQYDLIDYSKKLDGLLLKTGCIGHIKNFIFNFVYIDNSLAVLSEEITTFRYAAVSVNYNFSL